MKYGLHIPNFGAFGTAKIMAEAAQDAENAGWDGFFVWDHVARPVNYNLVDPWVALTAIAMATETIQFGTMVTPLPRRRPQVLARETVSLDVLSGGRLILGVGLGSGRPQEWSNFGEETDLKTRAQMTDEALDILLGLWSGEKFNFHGQHYTVENSQFLPRPVNGHIPIWIAGYYPSKPPMRRAAKYDGMFILFNDTDDKFVALRDTLDYILPRRETDTPFDAVYLNTEKANTPRQEIIDTAYQAQSAGATWWLSEMTPEHYDIERDENWHYDSMRDMILQGPPK